MKRVILDTNFLLIPGYFNVDIITEIERVCPFSCELYVLDRTIDEIHKIISMQKSRNATAAKVGLKVIEKNNIRIIRTDEPEMDVDDLIIRTAKEDGSIVATEDKDLMSRLRKEDIQLIIIRQKRYLQLS